MFKVHVSLKIIKIKIEEELKPQAVTLRNINLLKCQVGLRMTFEKIKLGSNEHNATLFVYNFSPSLYMKTTIIKLNYYYMMWRFSAQKSLLKTHFRVIIHLYKIWSL